MIAEISLFVQPIPVQCMQFSSVYVNSVQNLKLQVQNENRLAEVYTIFIYTPFIVEFVSDTVGSFSCGCVDILL